MIRISNVKFVKNFTPRTTKHCLQNHIDKCHHEKNMPKKLYECHICNKELSTLNPYLNTHIKIVHGGKKPHKCKKAHVYNS